MVSKEQGETKSKYVGKVLPFKRKRLFFDIEVSPCIGFFWKPGYKLNIPYENIITESAIICICYKWEGEKKVQSLTWDIKKCDKKMLAEFVKVANQADELVGHNGDKFDLAWIRTRCLIHRIPMFPKYISADTLKVSRSKFRFNSNRLDYISKVLGFGGKIETKFNLWRAITLENDEKSLNYMVKYCKVDVIRLEQVYTELKNHIEPKINYPALYQSERGGCPECGSDNIVVNQTRTTLTGMIKRQYECKGCGKYHSKTIPRNAA